MLRIASVLMLLVCAGCDGCGNYGPDTIPKDPGTVVAQVADQSGAPMREVWVYVHDIPNSVGSTYSVGRATTSAGVAAIMGIPAGRHRVEVKPPNGYAVPDIVTVDVVKAQSVTVAFVLAKL
jgi:hypothetical protein